MHIQLLHTSASLTINENWDPDVRDDMEMMLNRHDECNNISVNNVCSGWCRSPYRGSTAARALTTCQPTPRPASSAPI